MSISSASRDNPVSATTLVSAFAEHDALVLPAVPRVAERVPFPLIASAAPVLAAGAIWAITQSPFVLLFAALGPVVAIASMLDGRRQNARRARQEGRRFRVEMQGLSAELAGYHTSERAEAWAANPSALGDDSRRPTTDGAALWRSVGLIALTLGRGTVPSTVRVDATALSGASTSEADPARALAFAELRRFRNESRVLHDAPVLADAAAGIAVVGPPQLANAALRGLVVQLARACQPATVRLQIPPSEEWRWAAALPQCVDQHERGERSPATQPTVTVRLVDRINAAEQTSSPVHTADAQPRSSLGPVIFAIASSIEQVPAECATVLRLDSARSAVLVRSSDAGWLAHAAAELVPELVGREQANAMAQHLARRALQSGMTSPARSLPNTVALNQLVGYGTTTRGLSCVLGVASHGTIELDLVAQGPHAVVGGTTGSGKSELLVSWVISMAAAHAPTEFTVLLVDFKGGAAFSGLEGLPHCVGVLTDLDEQEATRALASLRAELRAREEHLRRERARSIDELSGAGSMPRLVIVVDEFAAMLSSFPDLHELFVDIAARGRSLGVHLVLCTQRPSGVVRDTLLANCSLRLSLRVNNAADSRAMLGTDAAALLSPALPGRALVDTGDGRVVEFHSAVANTAQLVGEICDAALRDPSVTGQNPLRRPWLPPLPSEIRLGDAQLDTLKTARGALSATPASLEFTLGMLDDPERQRRDAAQWRPSVHGPLLVLGAARTGRTSLLDTLNQQADDRAIPVTRCAATNPEAYWDTLSALASATPHELLARRENLRAAAVYSGALPQRLVLLDEWESVMARWPSDYQLAAGELLAQAVRSCTAQGIHIVLAASGLNGAIQSCRASWDAVLLLRLTEKSEHVRSGGQAALWSATAQAGRGEWRGLKIQCALPSPSHADGVVRAAALAPTPCADPLLRLDEGVLLVISTRPAQTVAALRGRVAAASDTPHCTVLDLAEVAPGWLPATVTMPRFDDSAAEPESSQMKPTVVIGDPDAWQARWGLFTTLRPQARLAFDGCRLADFRAFSRQRELPPLIVGAGLGATAAQIRVWAIDADGSVSRARLN